MKKNITRIFAVALHFQVASSLDKRLETHFEGTLHGTDTVSVYSRPGNLVASDDGNWLLIKSFEVTGQGKGLATTLPDFDFPVVVPAGFKQSFYVATNSTGIDFWYSPGTELGHAFASNDDLDILEGYAIGNAWKGFAVPRQWNGAVHYSVGANVPTASPIFESTSAAPSLKPSSYPSLLPTIDATTHSPTKHPSKQPTPQPTQPQPTMSPAPTQTNFKEPRSDTLRPTNAPASSSRRATFSIWTTIACLSLATYNK
eukprot:scaffold5559_cov193-Skeletonema_marinoi.AAC.10